VPLLAFFINPIAKARKKQYNKDRRNQKRGAADGEE
jgi:hypothetical protein